MNRDDMVGYEEETPKQHVKTFLIMVCVLFTIFMTTGLALGFVFGDEEARPGIMYGWGTLGACVISAGLQFVFFTSAVIKRMGYVLRTILFGISLYTVFAAIAILAGWFPIGNVVSWATFTVVFLVVLVFLSVLFHFKEKHARRALDEALARYRSGGER
ncbi:hypothetical protein HMPREF1155_1818 [Slackia sp. CM382]|uniref:DUF3021 family protein n=1 Tax=Slackia sp. CM382 TaxID=1111137 RepID=UPI00027C6B63|nr:DUF3021 family protein [Slackia sp. CM382]EJU33916.1 hypothetical protein HMPREF1155_1818 [Slackia sp. CM382]